MAVLENLQALFPGLPGGNGITGIHETIHVDPAGQKKRQGCGYGTLEQRTDGIPGAQRDPANEDKPDGDPDKREETERQAAIVIGPLGPGHGNPGIGGKGDDQG